LLGDLAKKEIELVGFFTNLTNLLYYIEADYLAGLDSGLLHTIGATQRRVLDDRHCGDKI
jgi:hypothetical protein